jgi:hypothetical protein
MTCLPATPVNVAAARAGCLDKTGVFLHGFAFQRSGGGAGRSQRLGDLGAPQMKKAASLRPRGKHVVNRPV